MPERRRRGRERRLPERRRSRDAASGGAPGDGDAASERCGRRRRGARKRRHERDRSRVTSSCRSRIRIILCLSYAPLPSDVRSARAVRVRRCSETAPSRSNRACAAGEIDDRRFAIVARRPVLDQQIGRRQHRAVLVAEIARAARADLPSCPRSARSVRADARANGSSGTRNASVCKPAASSSLMKAGLRISTITGAGKQPFGGEHRQRIVARILEKLLRRCDVHRERPVVRPALCRVDRDRSLRVVRIAADQ